MSLIEKMFRTYSLQVRQSYLTHLIVHLRIFLATFDLSILLVLWLAPLLLVHDYKNWHRKYAIFLLLLWTNSENDTKLVRPKVTITLHNIFDNHHLLYKFSQCTFFYMPITTQIIITF